VTPLRALYVDLDGTLMGAGASLLRDAEGGFSLLGARALEACFRADVEVVPFSGRRRDTLFWDARLMGLRSYVFEAGAGVVDDGEVTWLTEHRFAEIEASGAPELLVERFDLEYHDPWYLGREVSHLLRGRADAAEANAMLAENGLGHLKLLDNGAISRPGMRAYHLVPDGISKAGGIAAHMRIRGLRPDECIAVGDSREDLGAAAVVSRFWLVANAVRKDPSLAGEAARAGARVTAGEHGAGVYEAVMSELTERRG
jgi:hydroxymethylpyrimidine pyrophosphatase-like HAD family hydrolase